MTWTVINGYLVSASALIGLVVVSEIAIYFVPFTADVSSGALTTYEEKQIEVFIAIQALFASIATLIFAGTGAVLFKRPPGCSKQIVQGYLVLGSATLSVYLGYLSLRMLMWELDTGFLDLNISFIKWPRRLQIFLLLFSALVLGNLLVRQLSYDSKGSDPKP